jgi:hypothetical protein
VCSPNSAHAWSSIKRSSASSSFLWKSGAEQGYLKKRGSQRTDSTHILAAVHRYHRVELLPETLRAALNELAEQDPGWLQQWVPFDWFKRYDRRREESRLSLKKEEQEAFLEQVGRDGEAPAVDALSRRCPFSALSLASGTTIATHLGSALFLGRRATALEKQRHSSSCSSDVTLTL